MFLLCPVVPETNFSYMCVFTIVAQCSSRQTVYGTARDTVVRQRSSQRSAARRSVSDWVLDNQALLFLSLETRRRRLAMTGIHVIPFAGLRDLFCWPGLTCGNIYHRRCIITIQIPSQRTASFFYEPLGTHANRTPGASARKTALCITHAVSFLILMPNFKKTSVFLKFLYRYIVQEVWHHFLTCCFWEFYTS